MKKIISLFAILAITSSMLARELRTPQMPRGLTADKSHVTVRKVASNSSKKISKRKIKRKGLQGYTVRHHFTEMDFNELMVAKNQKIQDTLKIVMELIRFSKP